MLDLEEFLSETKESPPCGPNLEHDLAYFELEDAVRGKAEQQVGDAVKPAEDPNWPRVVELARTLLLRTKDLRVAVHLTRALSRTEGVPGLATGLGLIHGLLERYWDRIYPLLEADNSNDPTERLNALAPLAPSPGPFADPETLIKDLRAISLVNSREHGQLQARDVEIALGRMPPTLTAGVTPPKGLAQIHAQIAAAFASDRTVPTALRQARESTLAIQALIVDRVGANRAIDLKPLAQSLENLLEVCDTALGVSSGTAQEAEGQAPDVIHAGISREISTRQEAVRVLDLVCGYLERHEPSNPAPLFIRRAQRLMTKNFVDIVKDLLPDSLSNLEKLAGELEKK
jgi:type VI secretion system protein ImpA